MNSSCVRHSYPLGSNHGLLARQYDFTGEWEAVGQVIEVDEVVDEVRQYEGRAVYTIVSRGSGLYLVTAVTATGAKSVLVGTVNPILDKGHLQYYQLVLTGQSVLNPELRDNAYNSVLSATEWGSNGVPTKMEGYSYVYLDKYLDDGSVDRIFRTTRIVLTRL